MESVFILLLYSISAVLGVGTSFISFESLLKKIKAERMLKDAIKSKGNKDLIYLVSEIKEEMNNRGNSEKLDQAVKEILREFSELDLDPNDRKKIEEGLNQSSNVGKSEYIIKLFEGSSKRQGKRISI